MRSVKYILLVLLFLPAMQQVHADDIGLWAEAGFSKSISKKFSWGMEAGMRTGDDFGIISRIDIGASVSYKPVKFMKLTAGYALIFDHERMEINEHFNSRGKMNGYNINKSFWRPKNRLYFDVSGKLPIGRFSFTLRERYQYTRYPSVSYDREKYRGLVSDGYTGKQYGGYALDEETLEHKKLKQKHYLRSKLTAEYDIHHCPLTPFVSAEISNDFSDGFAVVKQRYTAGVDWKIKKKHVITLGYVYTNGHDDDVDGNIHAISVGYNFKF